MRGRVGRRRGDWGEEINFDEILIRIVKGGEEFNALSRHTSLTAWGPCAPRY